MTHPAIEPGAVAVITGGASGIGLAAAKKLASLGLHVCIADLGRERLEKARAEIGHDAIVSKTDVSRREELVALEAKVKERFGGVDILMNNAGVGDKTNAFGPAETYEKVLGVNLWGVIHGTQVFLPGMLEREKRGLLINTGSKQGITTPPGNPAYNVSKAGVKAYTEALQHELRNTPGCKISAHLFIPGFVFTGMSGMAEKPAAAWTAEQTVDFLLESLDRDDFYVLCPDNDVPRALDERRILWAAGDLVENRPALSRWHPDHAEAFKAFASKKGD